MLRTWKSALAPYLAGIPQRTGFIGELRLGLINDLRFGERALPRMIDRCGALALPKGAALPADWPLPEIVVPDPEVGEWRARRGLTSDASPIVALAPGAVGPGKKWPTENYAELAKALTQDGATVWILGGPLEKELAAQIVAPCRRTRARSHRQRFARRHRRAEGRRPRRHQRFRADAYLGGDRHAHHRHFRPDRSAALGPAQSPRRRDRAGARSALPNLREKGCANVRTAARTRFRRSA